MKKVFFAMLFCTSIAIAFGSCGNKTESCCDANDSVLVDSAMTDYIDSVFADSVCLD